MCETSTTWYRWISQPPRSKALAAMWDFHIFFNVLRVNLKPWTLERSLLRMHTRYLPILTQQAKENSFKADTFARAVSSFSVHSVGSLPRRQTVDCGHVWGLRCIVWILCPGFPRGARRWCYAMRCSFVVARACRNRPSPPLQAALRSRFMFLSSGGWEGRKLESFLSRFYNF